MLECGISYAVHCWYRKIDNVGKPVTVNDLFLQNAIHRGFFHSKYRDMFRFAIMWEEIVEQIAFPEGDAGLHSGFSHMMAKRNISRYIRVEETAMDRVLQEEIVHRHRLAGRCQSCGTSSAQRTRCRIRASI